VWGDTGSSVKWNKNHKVAGKPKAKCTALVYIDTDHKIRTAEGVKPKPKPTYSHSPSTPELQRRRRSARPSARLQRQAAGGIAKDGDVAFRLLLLEIARRPGFYVIPKLLKALPAFTLPPASTWTRPAAKLWPRIARSSRRHVVKALAAIGAASSATATANGTQHEKDCPPDLLAIAETLGIKPEPVKPTLSAIAADKAKAAAKAKPAAKKKAAAKKKHR
jgi:hypothetical protein